MFTNLLSFIKTYYEKSYDNYYTIKDIKEPSIYISLNIF